MMVLKKRWILQYFFIPVILLLGGIIMLISAEHALAITPEERLSDPVMEQRARAISQQLRCLVCQNETVDTSNTSFALSVRLFIRQRLVDGYNDQAVINDIVVRYGSYILLQPPLEKNTIFLWLFPVMLVMVAIVSAFFLFRRR